MWMATQLTGIDEHRSIVRRRRADSALLQRKEGRMAKRGYIFWDSETANSQQRICQVAYILTDLEGNCVGDPVCRVINPESEIGWWSRSHLEIDWDSLDDMPTFVRFWEDAGLADLLRDYILVAHNANGADIHHIKKSLAAYDIEMPEIEVIDTMLVAKQKGLPGALVDLCEHYGVHLDSHHDAMNDAEACLGVFRGLVGEFGALESSVWAPSVSSSHHGRKRVFTGLGLVNGSQETIEEILAKAEEAGHRGDPGEIADPVGLKVKVSGVTPGYNRDEILAALKECGMKATDGKPAQSTKYLAIGDNVGRSKLDVVFNGNSQAKNVTTGELLEVMNRFGKSE